MSSSTRFMAVFAIARMVAAQTAQAAPNRTTTGGAPPGGVPPAELKAEIIAAMLNLAFSTYLLIILASLTVALVIWRVGIESIKYIRTLTCLNNETQKYFVVPSKTFAFFKKHLIYAPLFHKRHQREFRLSAAVNIGTLPTRLQLFFLMGYFGTNVAFCVLSIQWDQSYVAVCEQLRNRTGTLALVNMTPLFLMAGRNNPLINLLNLSFDTFNLLHRWFGRIVVLEAVAHMFSWAAGVASVFGWAAVPKALTSDPMKLYGSIAALAFLIITIQASSVIRHAFYETFKYLHIALVVLVVITIYFHLSLLHLPQIVFLYGVIGSWAVERALRVLKLMYRNVGKGGTRTLVEALPGNACRVTMEMARPWNFIPGQHAYIYMPTLGLWTSHPFSIAWSEETENPKDEKLAMNRQDILAMRKTSMSFIIRSRTGFTEKLYKKASASPEGKFTTACFAEGPYGGMHLMHSYGTVMLIAGGVGITHQVPHVRDLVAGYANGTVAARKVVLIWIIRSPEHLEWIRPWMTSILAMDKRRGVLRIMLFVTRPRSTKEIHSPSATVQMFPGRPNFETLLDIEIESQVGAMGVSVCGGGELSDEVRQAVRSRQSASNIDFVEEAFSW